MIRVLSHREKDPYTNAAPLYYTHGPGLTLQKVMTGALKQMALAFIASQSGFTVTIHRGIHLKSGTSTTHTFLHLLACHVNMFIKSTMFTSCVPQTSLRH